MWEYGDQVQVKQDTVDGLARKGRTPVNLYRCWFPKMQTSVRPCGKTALIYLSNSEWGLIFQISFQTVQFECEPDSDFRLEIMTNWKWFVPFENYPFWKEFTYWQVLENCHIFKAVWQPGLETFHLLEKVFKRLYFLSLRITVAQFSHELQHSFFANNQNVRVISKFSLFLNW